ncbi:phage terminase large subunit family protein [Azospirillum sp. sgz301742]
MPTQLLDLSPGRAALAARMVEARRQHLKPPPRMTVDEWADNFRYLARGAGAYSGRWKTSKVEIARGPMRAVTEPGVKVISVASCTQLLKSSLLENAFGYFAHLNPAPILLAEPKDDAVQAFAKERVSPMVKATPVLRKLVGDPRTRNADNTTTFRRFPGGFLAMVAAGSPVNLAMRPVKVTLLDEVDKYPMTKEGPGVKLAEERLGTYADSLSIRACSPTDEDGEIAKSYAASDQRRAFVSCPRCGHRQVLDFFSHVHWDKGRDGVHLPETARVVCERCNVGWSEAERLEALSTVRWAQTRPFSCCGRRHDPLSDYATAWRVDGLVEAWESVWCWDERNIVGRAICGECGRLAVPNRHAGFTASKLYSPHANDVPAEVARKWLEAKSDTEARQTFFNTQLGQAYRGQADKKVEASALMARREVWPAEVPDGVALLTAGIDWQGLRFEIEVVGWGRDEESWSIAYEVGVGDPAQPEVWQRLDEILTRRYLRADGRPFVIEAACMDSGHHTNEVYSFCRARAARRVWAIKGESAKFGARNPVWPAWKPNTKWRDQFRPILLGVNSAKDTIRSRLALTEPGPGFCHFPHDRDAVWFDQLTAERLELKAKGGRAYRVWTLPRGRANEATDCRVYSYAALHGLLSLGVKLNSLAAEVGANRGSLILAGTPEAERLLAARAAVPIVERKPAPRRSKGPRVVGGADL